MALESDFFFSNLPAYTTKIYGWWPCPWKRPVRQNTENTVRTNQNARIYPRLTCQISESTVVWRGLYSYRQWKSSSRRSKSVVDSRGAAERIRNKFYSRTLITNIVVDKSTDHAKPLPICFRPRYQLRIKRNRERGSKDLRFDSSWDSEFFMYHARDKTKKHFILFYLQIPSMLDIKWRGILDVPVRCLHGLRWGTFFVI